jgi:tetratricopeptide (TPR) repeat protein
MRGATSAGQYACHPVRAPFLCKAIIARLARILVVFLLIASLCAQAESAQSLLAAGRVDDLIQQLHDPQTADSYSLLCRAHFELGEWDAGIPLCEKAVALAPENGLYHLWLGRIYGEKADHTSPFSAMGLAKKVRVEFERAIELNPDSWEARTDLAEFYVEAPGIVGGGKDKARAQAEALMPLNPAMSHWVRARLAEKNKDEDEAEREYRAAIQASHGGARAWLNLAGFYRHTGRVDAMEQALLMLETTPLDHPGALVDGASILIRSGHDPALATRLLHRYLDSANTVEEAPVFKAHLLMGEIYEKQADRARAAEQYRAALALAHTYRPAQEALRRVS